jgi:HEAT repeat protein
LSFWLDQYRLNWIPGAAEQVARREEARAAVRHIGSNAIPYLLDMLRETDSPLKMKLLGFVQKHTSRIYASHAWIRNGEAVDGFEILGADAKAAVPALIRIFEQRFSPSSQSFAARALARIGPVASNAIPTLLPYATKSNDVRIAAVDALGLINTAPAKAIPALVGCLNDPSGSATLRISAARALLAYGSEAREAIPALVQLVEDMDSGVRYAAAQALKQIDPAAAGKIGVK